LFHHAVDKALVFALVFCGSLGVEGYDRQQVFGVREHFLLDHFAQLFVAGPVGVAAGVVGAGAQHEVDDLVAEVFGVGDAGGLLDFLELVVQRAAIETFSGFGVAEFFVLYPAIGKRDVPVEDVLPVLGIRFQVGGLDFLADELSIPRRQVALDEIQVAAPDFFRVVFAGNALFKHVHQVHRVGGHFGLVMVEHAGQDLVGKARGYARHAFVGARVVFVFLQGLGLGVDVFERLAVVHAQL